MRRALVSLLIFACATALAAQEPKPVTVLKAARLIDGTGAPVIRGALVVITGDTITAVGPATTVAIPGGAKVIDLGDATLMPGLIDAHTHLIGRSLGDPGWDTEAVRDFGGYGAILGVANARKTLLGGITSVRNVGAPDFNDIALRKAIDESVVPGPRMQTAGHALGITGGHCDENGYKPGLMDLGVRQGVANGPDEVRSAVRYQAKYGADVIKACATGGVLSEGDAVGATQYTYDEMKAIVDEATKLGRKVAAHAHGAEGIKIAVRAGVASIEHGSFLDDEGARMMVARGTWLVPTLAAGEAIERAAKNGVLKGARAEKALAAAGAVRNAIRIAVANHVQIAMGTDAGVIAHGTNAHELTLLVEWGGMSPMDAISAATMGSARLLGWDKRVGSLAPGKLADVIALPGDPLQDIHRVERVDFVMKGGVVYRQP